MAYVVFFVRFAHDTWHMIQFLFNLDFLFVLVSMLLSAHVERFSVSCMRDFLKPRKKDKLKPMLFYEQEISLLIGQYLLVGLKEVTKALFLVSFLFFRKTSETIKMLLLLNFKCCQRVIHKLATNIFFFIIFLRFLFKNKKANAHLLIHEIIYLSNI